MKVTWYVNDLKISHKYLYKVKKMVSCLEFIYVTIKENQVNDTYILRRVSGLHLRVTFKI